MANVAITVIANPGAFLSCRRECLKSDGIEANIFKPHLTSPKIVAPETCLGEAPLFSSGQYSISYGQYSLWDAGYSPAESGLGLNNMSGKNFARPCAFSSCSS